MDIQLSLFVLLLALAFANGTNDVSKAIATLVGSGITHYHTAIVWGTVWTILGACAAGLVASAMVKTFSSGLMAPGTAAPPALALAVLTGATIWVLIATRTGLPVSTTHALTGAIVGGGLATFMGDELIWSAIAKKIALPLFLSPPLALALSFLFHPALRMAAARWEGAGLCLLPASRALVTIDAKGMTRILFQTTGLGQPVVAVPSQCDRASLRGITIGLDSFHWISSVLASFARS